MSQENGRPSWREYIDFKFATERQHTDQQFVALRDAFLAYCKMADTEREDHEKRIRAQEKQGPWRTVGEGLAGLIAIIAMALGLQQP